MRELGEIVAEAGIDDWREIDPRTVPVEQWVRMKCLFGCGMYGTTGTCPPATPSIPECREFVHSYTRGALFHREVHWQSPEQYQQELTDFDARIRAAEKEAFLSGYYKAFLLVSSGCTLCKKCTAAGRREGCVNRRESRPGMDSMGIDVFATARAAGYSVEVMRDKSETMNRFALLLVE